MAIWQTFYNDLHICIRNTVILVEGVELEFHSMLSLPSLETATEPTMTRSMETLSFRLIFLLCSFTPWNHTHTQAWPTKIATCPGTPIWQTTRNTISHTPAWQMTPSVPQNYKPHIIPSDMPHHDKPHSHVPQHDKNPHNSHIQQTTLKTTQYQQT